MAISTISPKFFLGALIPNVKILSSKVDEIINLVNGTVGSVTQLTNITTGVTLNATRGVITTVALTTAAGAVSGPFTVTNNKVLTTSVISATIEYAAGKTGAPFIIAEGVSNGSFKLKVANGGSAVLNDIVKIHFRIMNP